MLDEYMKAFLFDLFMLFFISESSEEVQLRKRTILLWIGWWRRVGRSRRTPRPYPAHGSLATQQRMLNYRSCAYHYAVLNFHTLLIGRYSECMHDIYRNKRVRIYIKVLSFSFYYQLQDFLICYLSLIWFPLQRESVPWLSWCCLAWSENGKLGMNRMVQKIITMWHFQRTRFHFSALISSSCSIFVYIQHTCHVNIIIQIKMLILFSKASVST